MVTKKTTRRAARAAVAATIAAAVMVGLAASDGKANTPACTHGVSSIGPVYLKDGKVVGDATPHTQACLP